MSTSKNLSPQIWGPSCSYSEIESAISQREHLTSFDTFLASRTIRVLVVEDYAPIRHSITRAMVEAGYSVQAVATGHEGLCLAESYGFDVIVLDLMLPGIDGLTVLRRLAEQGNQARVLIMSAKDEIGDRVRGLDLGADDYLAKPFALEELLARVRALVRRKYAALITGRHEPQAHAPRQEVDGILNKGKI